LPDLLVPLYGDLPAHGVPGGVWIGRPLAHQAPAVLSFVARTFGTGWEAEARTAFSGVPATLQVAVDTASGEVIGFCCWDCTARGFLGPVGVSGAHRGSGTGRALVTATLRSMREAGYAYAIVGAAGPVEFFRRCCGATVIEGSDPGLYGNPIGTARE
jgi:GNAT superfamily N-acetyltransferase